MTKVLLTIHWQDGQGGDAECIMPTLRQGVINMFIDERIYTLKNGNVKSFLALYEAEGKDVQMRIFGHMIGYFCTDIGPLNKVVHLWGYDSMDDRYRRRAELQERPEWRAYAKQMRPLVRHIENKILIPTEFSPIGGIATTKSCEGWKSMKGGRRCQRIQHHRIRHLLPDYGGHDR